MAKKTPKQVRFSYWRRLACSGCAMRCRYKDFKVFGTHAYQEMYEALWKDDEDSSTWQYKSRGVILGKLHEIKRKAWEEQLSRCPGFD